MSFIEVEKRAGVLLALLVLAASIYLITPFLVPMFWAALMALTTWPLMVWLNNKTHRPMVSATILTTLWSVLVLAPLVALVAVMAVEAKSVIAFVTQYTSAPLPDLPSFVGNLPLVGHSAAKTWAELQAQGGAWFDQFKPIVNRMLHFAVAHGSNVAHVVMHVLITIFFVFMFYWQGESLTKIGHQALGKLVGDGSRRYVEIVVSTLKNVINGIVGTALAQAILSVIGFWIAGVPGAVLLGVATFFLSLIPMGAPLVWLPAVGWLAYQGESGWAIFVALWCLVVIGGVDHILKPLLISRGSILPLSLVLIGVFGGILNWGFLGIFVGPAILALGYSLVMVWVEGKKEAGEVQSKTGLEQEIA